MGPQPSPVGMHAYTQVRSGPEGDGGRIAGDGQSFNEEPTARNGINKLEVDFVLPVFVGEDPLG